MAYKKGSQYFYFFLNLIVIFYASSVYAMDSTSSSLYSTGYIPKLIGYTLMFSPTETLTVSPSGGGGTVKTTIVSPRCMPSYSACVLVQMTTSDSLHVGSGSATWGGQYCLPNQIFMNATIAPLNNAQYQVILNGNFRVEHDCNDRGYQYNFTVKCIPTYATDNAPTCYAE